MRCLADAGELDAAEEALLATAAQRDWAVLLTGVDPRLAALRARPSVSGFMHAMWGATTDSAT